jgi:RND family efflux transporter MFP subunit
MKGILSRPWLKWLLLACVLAAGSFGYYRYRRQQAAGKLPDGVQVAKAERQTIDQVVTATGVVSSQTGTQVKIGAQLSGRIKELKADVGQQVKAGDSIAVLDLPEVVAQVQQARDNLSQARSRLEQAKLNASLTRETTVEDEQQAQAAVDAATARIASSEAMEKWQPEQTQAEKRRAAAALETAKSTQKQVQASVDMQLNQAQTTIDAEKSNLENLRRQLARNQALHGRGFVGLEVVDNLRTQVDQSVSRLANARATYGIVKEKTEADLQQAEDAVTQAKAALDAANAGTFQDQQRKADKENALHARAQALAQLALARSNKRQQAIRDHAVREAQGAVDVAEHQLQYQLVQLDKTTIRTPISGTVLSIAAQQGETVAAQFQTPTLIVVADLKRLEVKAYVDENDIGRIRIGLPARVEVDSYPDRRFTGHVSKIASASTVKDNVVTYETTIVLDKPGGLLKPDMTAKVEISLARRPDVLVVPSEAIKRVGEDQVVYVLPPDGRPPQKRSVKSGLADDMNTEILQGVKPGETVLLSGLEKYGIQTGFTVRR